MIGGPIVGSDCNFNVTFDNGVGVKAIRGLQQGKQITLEIPVSTTANGGGGAIGAPAGSIPADIRPVADTAYNVVVTNNAAKVVGKLVIGANGSIVFRSSAADAVFTAAAVAGWDRLVVQYLLA